MARTSSSPPPLPAEMITVNLERLLSRLDKKLPSVASTEYARGGGGGGGGGGRLKPQIEREEIPGVVERRKIAAVRSIVALFFFFLGGEKLMQRARIWNTQDSCCYISRRSMRR